MDPAPQRALHTQASSCSVTHLWLFVTLLTPVLFKASGGATSYLFTRSLTSAGWVNLPRETGDFIPPEADPKVTVAVVAPGCFCVRKKQQCGDFFFSFFFSFLTLRTHGQSVYG